MSYFACISFDKKYISELNDIVNENCNDSFTGKICKGNKKEFTSYFLKIYFHSGSKVISNDEANSFMRIIERAKLISFNLILHWYSGDIYNEQYKIKDTVKISYTQFKNIILELEEDIKYKIIL